VRQLGSWAVGQENQASSTRPEHQEQSTKN